VPERRFRMSVLTLEGWVEGGQVRLREEAVLPDKTKVYVVVPGAEEQVPRIRSPRLADPAEASQFEMEVTELPEGRLDAKL
jgi:hypothetical protein